MPHNRDETGQAYIDPGPFDRDQEGKTITYTNDALIHATENAQVVICHLLTVLKSLEPPASLPPYLLDEYTGAVTDADLVIETMLDLLLDPASILD